MGQNSNNNNKIFYLFIFFSCALISMMTVLDSLYVETFSEKLPVVGQKHLHFNMKYEV